METIVDPFSQILWQDPSILPLGSAQSIEEQVKEKLHRNENRFPTFLAHLSSLEKKGRGTETVFINKYIQGFTDRSFIDRGATFSVEKAVAIPNQQTTSFAPAVIRQQRVVAVKSVRLQSQLDELPKAGWDHVLLEIRALLHETLRYHPNIVRLIGLYWGPNGASGNVYPQLVIEHAEHGTLEDLQNDSKSPLPFAFKQKLLYDAGKGLSIIHACSIIHGDIKRQNVLVFADKSSHGPYIAKLADFGGAIHGSEKYDSYRFICKTPRYAAPETDGIVTSEAAKLCDVYSFGLLVCETFNDGDLSSLHSEFSPQHNSITSSVTLAHLKQSGRLLHRATSMIQDYFDTHEVNQSCAEMVLYVLEQTIQKSLGDRSLAKAQVALRGIPISEIGDYLSNVDQMNRKWKEVEDNEPPGKHGISADGAGLFLGTIGATYDPQNNTPGFRPKVKAPVDPGFVFEPEKLKKILSWQQQEDIVRDLQAISDSGDQSRDVELHKLFAAWFLFRCHIAEFGTSLDPEKACAALRRAASNAVTGSDDSSGFEYLAASCVWRVCQALGQTPPELLEVLPSSLEWATLRGGWQAAQDLEDALPLLSDEAKGNVTETFQNARRLANYFSGVPGSLAFLPRYLRRDFKIENVEQLQQELKEELGVVYEQSLKSSDGKNENGQQVNYFDRIFVNSRGHGLLHMAAARGQAKAINHLVNTFKLNIDLPNQDCEETPLVCSCRNAHLEASLALLQHGADPKGHPLGQDTPLHWLWRFEKEDMMPMANGLLDAGAMIDAASGGMRAEVLKAHADWEGTMSISTTPLGRCVLFQNIHAAEVLIKLGADPMFEIKGKSPFQLAAMLALPKFLRLFLSQGHTESRIPGSFNGYDDFTLLKMTQEQEFGNRDTFSLLSRLIRNGPRYRSDIEETLAILKEQREYLGNDIFPRGHPGEALCMQIRLGNRDIVEALLKMGHDPSGSPGYRPMREAVLINDKKVFQVLRDYGGEIESYPEWPRTLLHDLAGRPASSPPGTVIAQYLIDSGVSVLDHPLNTRPPVVEAILHGYFDLANLLIQHGARIGCPYQLGPELPRITIFKQLLEQRSEMSLSILQSLLRPNDRTAGHELILHHNEQFDFIVDHIGNPAEQQSAWMILATSPPARQDVVEAEIYMAQVQCMLSGDSPFASKECINFDHQRFGTALCRATLFQNHFLVGKLLLSGADPNIRFQQIFGPAQRYFGDGSPANLALGCYEVAIEGWNDTVPDAILEDMRSVINELESIRDYPDEFLTLGETLRKRHKDLLSIRNDTRALQSQMANMNFQQNPCDLSCMSAIQASDLDESQRETFQDTEIIIRWLFDSQRYGTIGRAEMARIASGENA
ncbi:hypothetical protein KAF25_011025 [Fusarium avenaceum]|uniref:Protein kinase domain-containing protein n=1 Tax=Fusarium avenaceum TaxID=40199 RepID=A0A9P7GV03_9HYPO|nr:hypothetical protein KAF25_011025 [Fusarium avenaceum]